MNRALRYLPAACLPLVALSLFACSDRDDDADETASATTDASETAEATRTATATVTPSATRTATASGPAEFEVERALAHIEHLASVIGPRVSGMPEEDETVAYIREQFEAAGYSVELFEFAFQSDPFRTSTLTVGSEIFESYAMTGSGGGDFSAPLAWVGLADDAGIGGQDLTGKIAVADRGVLRFSETLANVEAAGAIALVVINNESGEFVGNLTSESDLPAVTVAGSAGESLRALAQAGEDAALDVPGGSTTASVNVIARAVPGEACRIIVGGHHDTVAAAPGAHDNGSGTGTVIELARALAADGLDEGLCFATFGGEESGLNGSRALAQELASDDELPEIMINIDANGVGSRVQLIGTRALTEEALALASELEIPADITQLGANFGSDHQSFEAEGVPVLFFSSDSLGNLHTPEDTFDTIDAGVVEASGTLANAFLTQLLAETGTG